MLTGSVAAAFTMMRRALDVDWRRRTFALRDIPGRIAEIEARWVRSRPGSSRWKGPGAAGRGRRAARRRQAARRAQGAPAAPRPARRADRQPGPAVACRPRAHLHRAVREAPRDDPRARRGGLAARTEDGRDHHPRDGPRRPRERRPAARGIRRPVPPLLPHPRPARAGDRRRQEQRDGLRRAMAVSRARRAWASTRARCSSRTSTRTTASTRATSAT